MFLDKLCKDSQCDCHHGFIFCHVSMHNASSFLCLIQVGANTTIMSPTNTCPFRNLFKPSIDSILGVISLDLVTFFEQEK
jgi:hypothetical protein